MGLAYFAAVLSMIGDWLRVLSKKTKEEVRYEEYCIIFLFIYGIIIVNKTNKMFISMVMILYLLVATQMATSLVLNLGNGSSIIRTSEDESRNIKILLFLFCI